MRHLAYPMLISSSSALLLFGLAALLGAGARPIPQVPASGTYVVNSVLDEPDADPSNGICLSTPSGQCTLRAAIMEANYHTDVNTITVPAGVYLLTRFGYDDGALVGDLDITQQLVLQGAGAGVTIVDGNSAVTADRVFQVLDTAPIVTISGLTIRHGRVPTSGAAGPSWGGGILLDNRHASLPILRLKDVILEGNSALTGGGLYSSVGQVDLQNTTVRANAAVEGGAGGGIYSAFGSTLTIQDSQVYSNSANQGGGVALEGSLGTRIERSEFYSNTAAGGDGGGLFSTATFDYPINPLTVVDSNLHDNFAASAGGAISTNSTLVLSGTVLNANHAQFKGGGLFTVPGGGATVTVQASTLSRNTAQFGGALEYEGASGPLTVVNSTLSHNSVSHDGGGLYASGGARVRLFNTTIAANALSRVHLQTNPMRGGGVFITDTAVITAANTVLADNYYTNNLTQVIPDDCFATVTSLHSLGYNLLETTSNCLVSGTTFGNVTGQDPKLGPLQNNYGATPTQALLLGSPAIDAGEQPFCENASGAPLTTDQRGLARPGGARCDIGAFEYYTVYPVLLPFIRR